MAIPTAQQCVLAPEANSIKTSKGNNSIPPVHIPTSGGACMVTRS
jgi:hypothetical protein